MPPLPPQHDSDALDLEPEQLDPLADRELHEAMHRLCDLADVNPVRRRHRRLVAFSGVATLWAEAAFLVAAQSVGLS